MYKATTVNKSSAALNRRGILAFERRNDTNSRSMIGSLNFKIEMCKNLRIVSSSSVVLVTVKEGSRAIGIGMGSTSGRIEAPLTVWISIRFLNELSLRSRGVGRETCFGFSETTLMSSDMETSQSGSNDGSRAMLCEMEVSNMCIFLGLTALLIVVPITENDVQPLVKPIVSDDRQYYFQSA